MVASLLSASGSSGKALKAALLKAIERKYHLTAAELAAAFAVWRGIADWNFPASLVIAGIAIIVAVEIRG